MKPCQFPEANVTLHPPSGFAEVQVGSAPAFVGQVRGGSCDGQQISIMAWELDDDDMRELMVSRRVHLCVFGKMPAHRIGVSFQEALSE